MNDVQLFSSLLHLGMPKDKAWTVTQKIRDVYHPVAAVAASKILTAQGLGAGIVGGTNQATKTIGLTLTGAKAGATIGSVFPVVGTVIGAAVGAAIGAIGSLFGPAKEGQAAVTWDNMVKSGYLQQNLGRAFDERYFAEAMKGAMDEGNNVWHACGADGHKNPDCFYGPLAQQIVQGYLTGKVPLSASTAQVMQSVVNPWLQSGASGLFNWAPYAAENAANGNMQGLLVQGAVDRYLAGLPITRADMPEYIGQGYTQHQPSINTALASLLQTTAPPPAAAPTPSVAVAQSPVAQVPAPVAQAAATIAAPVVAAGVAPTLGVPTATVSSVATPSGTTPAATVPVTPQADATAALLQQILANQQAVNMTSPPAQQLLANVATNGVQTTPLGPPVGGFDMTTLILPGAIVAGGLLLYLALSKSAPAP